MFLPSTGYQAYTRFCGHCPSHRDSECPSEDACDTEVAKENMGAVINRVFEFDENVKSEEKSKANDTQLRQYKPSKHRLWNQDEKTTSCDL